MPMVIHYTFQASLKRLNRNISPPVDMPVFRPNLVVDGGTAFEDVAGRG